MTNNQKLVVIPFSGFYNSIHDQNIDDGINTQIENCLYDDGGSGDVEGFYGWVEDWKQLYIDYAKSYVESLNTYLYDELEIPTHKNPLAIESLDSPRECNYGTHRIFCYIPNEIIQSLYDTVNKNLLRRHIVRSFTPCDGFIPHYSADVQDWLKKPLMEWDHNELAILLETVCFEPVKSNYPLVGLENILIENIDVSEIVGEYVRDYFYIKSDARKDRC